MKRHLFTEAMNDEQRSVQFASRLVLAILALIILALLTGCASINDMLTTSCKEAHTLVTKYCKISEAE